MKMIEWKKQRDIIIKITNLQQKTSKNNKTTETLKQQKINPPDFFDLGSPEWSS